VKGGAFSLYFKGKKDPRRVAVQLSEKEEKREYVTEITDSDLQSVVPKDKDAAFVIPKQENTFKVGIGNTAKAQKARASRFLPVPDDSIGVSTEQKFEAAPIEDPDSSIRYGLTEMAPSKRADSESGGAAITAVERVLSQQEKEAQKMKEDVDRLPDAISFDAYEKMPIEKFGAAMLRGMGWKEGMNVGRSQGKEVKAVEYVARPGRLGLGAEPAGASAKPERKRIRPGESREGKADLVVAPGADGRQRNVRSLDEKLVRRERSGVHKDKVMRVIGGDHEGFLCRVLEVDDASRLATVRLSPSEEVVTVSVSELGERRAEPPERSLEKGGPGDKLERRSSGESRRDDREKGDREKGGDRHRREQSSKKRDRRSSSEEPEQGDPWLTTYIRVRIVDKRLGRGKLYLKKGTVVDVHGPRSCDLRVDETRETVQGVSEKQLETLVPKTEGTPVIVLRGPLKWQKAKLLQRNTKTNAAAIQMASDFSIERLCLDDISEYVGPSEDD